MGRKLADLWDYADRLDKRFKCRFCFKDFTGGVVRLRSHLSGVKGGGIQLCSKVSEQAKNDALSSLNVVNKKRKTGPSSSDSDGGSSDICDANCNSEVGYSVAKYFFMSDTNCNMVESLSFTNLINALNPGSTLPSSLELESKLIPSFKTEVEQYVSGAKQSWAKTGCTLIPIFELDEKEGRFFLSIFGCSSERTVLLDTFEVPTNVDLVAPFLEETVHSVVQSIGSHNIVQIVVDGSQYGEYFSKFLCSKFPLVYLTKCAAREVQLMFEEIFQDVEWVRTTFNIIKSIVDYIWSDTTILSLLSKYTNGKKLKQSLGVNFLSSYKMLESILEVKDHLVQLVQSPEWVADYGKGQRGIEVTSYIKNPKTWERGEEVQKALRSLSQVLCLIDIHDSNSGYLYGLMEFVEHSISQLKSNNQDMYQRLWDIYMLKKGQILSEFHSVAAFLNPAYMRTEQAKNVDRNPVISYIMERFIAEGNREEFVKEVYEYRKILSDGSKLFESTAAKAYHPCQWWETCGQNLTMLRNLAIRILSQPSSASTCKSSMRTVEAALVKEQREMARGITDLDLKMNAILMERYKKVKAYHERDKIVLEEFSIHRSNNGESTSRPLRQLKLCFMTEIASPIRIGQNVEGKKGCRIHVCLEDTTTGRVVQDGIPSTLPLTISVLDGHFSNEASSEEHSTREYFNRNELPGECPYITGDLGVTLIRGEGTLGNFSFNYSSVNRESGQFKLAVKTHTGFCDGFRILEGISNAFTVEDVEAEVRIEQPVAHVDPQNGSFSSNPGLNWASDIDPFTENESDFPLAQWIATPYYPVQGFDQSLAQTASRRVKKKALNWQLQSRGRRRTLKRGSQSLKRKRRGEEVFEPKREVSSTGSNNINGQEEAEKHDEPMELEEVDSLSCCSTSAVARDYISAKPEGFEMTLFGDRVAASSSGAEPIRETPAHPSTALQLSISTRVNNVNHQKEDDKEVALKEFVPQLHSISIKKRKGIGMFEEWVCNKCSKGYAVQSKELQNIGRLVDASELGFVGVFSPSGLDPGDERIIDYTCIACLAAGHASKDFVLHSTSSDERKKGFIQEETSFKDYEVFLSFRGKDTRCGFADMWHQYMIDAEIKAFVDKPATLSGDSIEKTTVMNAIDNSKICVCIFSRTYASSSWCLRELERMAQKNKDVIPVFYGVTPDDVQLKTSMYTDELAMHETKYDKEQVKQWREALIKVGKLKGFELKDMSLSDSMNELVGLISSKLKVKPKYEIQHFVEVEDHINNALSLLDIESRDKQILGIHGISGIGIAKCIFNLVSDKFDNAYFLESSSLKTEMEVIEESHGKKILVVLDGVDNFHDNGKHIVAGIDTSWFGSGSRIIVTTRNRGFLKDVFWYDLAAGMDALTLFSKNAFGLDNGECSLHRHNGELDMQQKNRLIFLLAQWIGTPYPLQGFDQSLAQTSTRRVMKKWLMWQLQSRGRWRTLKRGSQTLKRKRRGEEVFEPKREVYSTGGNNVNEQEEIWEEDDEPMELEEVDSLSCCSTSAVARDYISAKPEGFAVTFFGDIAAACSSGAKPIRETPAHPSTALQLSISTRVNNVNHQKEDDKVEALKEFVPQLHSISIKKRKGICMFEATDGAETTKEVAYEFIKNMNGHRPSPEKRPGDCNCSSCQHLNFQRRESCQRIMSEGRVVSNGASFGFIGSDIRPGDWYCTAGNCGTHNFASRSTCFKCGALKDELTGLGRFDSSDSISELVGLISSHLKVKPKYEIKHFVEVEDHINNALTLLDTESGDNRIIGIIGIGGIGKTTLAQWLFNLVSDNKFDNACFLESTSLKTEVEMMNVFHGKKILVVLEGVENCNHKGKHILGRIDTSWFGSGSRIIVTTNNRGLLKKMKNVVWYDSAAGLNAFTLFSKNAFGLDSGVCSMQQKNRHNGELDMQQKNRHNGGGISRTQRMAGIRMFEGTDGAESSTKEVAYEIIKNMNRSRDWNSSSCNHLNFQSRDSCQRCGNPKLVSMDFAGRVVSNGASFGFIGSDIRPGDWYCAATNCGTHNFASRMECFRCNAPRDITNKTPY